MQLTHLILAIFGFISPYTQLLPFISEHGLDLQLFWSQLFINHISSDFALDLFVSSIAFCFFLFQEGAKLKMRFLWIYVGLNLVIGMSFALPLFLFVRSRKIDEINEIDRIQSSSVATQIIKEAT